MKAVFLLLVMFTVACSCEYDQIKQPQIQRQYNFDKLKNETHDSGLSQEEDYDMFIPVAEAGC